MSVDQKRMRQTPEEDLGMYRRALSQFGTGVTVITAKAKGSLAGVTANSFTSVSLEPPLVLWSLKNSSQSLDTFMAAEYFAVNILASDQIDLCKKFSASGPDKFDGVSWREGDGGAPVLDGALATYECRCVGRNPGGDHIVLTGQVEHFSCKDGEPLLFVQGGVSVPREHPDMGAKPLEERNETGALDTFLASLLYRAYGELSQNLESGRRAESVSLLQSRILSGIETFPGLTSEQLAERLFLGDNTANFTLDGLVELGLVSVNSVGIVQLTTAGQAKADAVHARCRALEEKAIVQFSNADIAATRRVLAGLIHNKPGKETLPSNRASIV